MKTGLQRVISIAVKNSSIIVIILVTAFFVSQWNRSEYWKKQRILINDVVCYYNYLPAAFIYHDLSFEKKPDRWGFSLTDDKIRVQKMSMGVSFFYAPFFFAAMAYVKAAGLPMNEYSTPFEIAISLSSLLYALLGMIVLRKVLKMFYSDGVTALCILAIFGGTNLYYYTVYEGPMSHVYSFFLISCLLYLTVRWHEKPTVKNTILAGLTAGMIVLVRPTNIVVLIVPVLFGITNRESLLQKLALLRQHWPKLLLMAVMAFVVFIPQMLYWKTYTGHWVVYSYGHERFFWANPQIIMGMFGYRNGWLVYSPLMFLALAGFFFLWRYNRKLFFAVLIYFLVNIYVVFSWWCYWYVGFGLRAMIDCTAVLALPLGAFLTWIIARKWFLKIVFFLVFFFFIELSLYQTMQYSVGYMHYDGMTKKLYWAIFFKNKWPKGYDEMLKRPDYEKAFKGEY